MQTVPSELFYQQVGINEKLCHKLEIEHARVEQYAEAYDHLKIQFAKLQRQHFGSKSERYIEDQLPLFGDLSTPEDQEDDEAVVVSSHKRKKKVKNELPVTVRIIPVTDDQRICPCGKEKCPMGFETKKILNYKPAVFEMIEERREKLGCDCEQGGVTVAPKPLHILPKAEASESLLAHLVSSKIRDRQPFYHLEKQLRSQYGVNLSRQTMSRWFIELTKPLQPIYNLLKDELLDYEIASCDATKLQVLKEPGRRPQTKSLIHCMRGGAPGREVILFAYTPSDHSEFLVEWFQGWTGKLHTDASPIFDQLENTGVTIIACNLHARRKFEEITKATKKNGLAAHAMRVYKKLYRIERKAKEEEMSPEQRLALRQKESKPIMDEYKEWLEEYYPKVLPQSHLGRAMEYVIKHWENMTRFLDDGRCEIDNNHTERDIKLLVLARKNFLFCDTMPGANALAMHASLALTAELHHHNVCRYFTYLYERLPHCKTLEDIEALLPWNVPPDST